MSNLQYAKSIRNLAVMFKDMTAAADALEKLGSVEMAVKESEAKLESTRLALQASTAELVASDTLVKQAAEHAKALEVNAGCTAEALVQRAESDAAGILDAAKYNAGVLLDETAAKIDAMLLEGNEAKLAIECELAALDSKKAAAAQELVTTQSELDNLQARYAEVKAKLQSLLE